MFQFKIKHLLADPEKITMFQSEAEFIKFVKKIAIENDDESISLNINNIRDCVHYITTYCPNLKLVEDKSLEELLEEWSIMAPGDWDNETGPKDWYAVTNDTGIIAYFGESKDAFGFRLNKINQILNG